MNEFIKSLESVEDERFGTLSFKEKMAEFIGAIIFFDLPIVYALYQLWV